MVIFCSLRREPAGSESANFVPSEAVAEIVPPPVGMVFATARSS